MGRIIHITNHKPSQTVFVIWAQIFEKLILQPLNHRGVYLFQTNADKTYIKKIHPLI